MQQKRLQMTMIA